MASTRLAGLGKVTRVNVAFVLDIRVARLDVDDVVGLEEDVLVTEQGCRFLSSFPKEPIVL